MIAGPWDRIGMAEVLEHLRAKVPESRSMEYKEELPKERKNQDRNEFLYDVSAFGNSGGGDILYGVSEERDADEKSTGRPEKVVGLETINVAQEVDGPVILIRIPRSWVAPHMVCVDDSSKFYVRVGPQKQLLDREGIRQAFLASESLRSRLERFRDERLGRLLADETPVPVEQGWRMVLHILPMAALDRGQEVELAIPAVDRERPGWLQGIERHNFDGRLFVSGIGPGNKVGRYAQVFRHGAIEIVEGPHGSDETRKLIQFAEYEGEILETVGDSLRLFERAGVQPPVYVLLAMLGVKGYRIWANHQDFVLRPELRIDRENLVFPEVVIEDFDEKVWKSLRPLFDCVWQSSGYEKCLNYDQTGRHIACKTL